MEGRNMEQIKFDKEYQLFIGRNWKKASDNCTIEVICPSNGKKLRIHEKYK